MSARVRALGSDEAPDRCASPPASAELLKSTCRSPRIPPYLLCISSYRSWCRNNRPGAPRHQHFTRPSHARRTHTICLRVPMAITCVRPQLKRCGVRALFRTRTQTDVFVFGEFKNRWKHDAAHSRSKFSKFVTLAMLTASRKRSNSLQAHKMPCAGLSDDDMSYAFNANRMKTKAFLNVPELNQNMFLLSLTYSRVNCMTWMTVHCMLFIRNTEYSCWLNY